MAATMFGNWYQANVVDAGDPRTKGWSLIDSPVPIGSILIVYYVFIRLIGPRLMRDRQPLRLRILILGYNAAQVVACSSVLWQVIDLVMAENWFCSEIFTGNADRDVRIPVSGWYYFMLKIIDLADTVFFVLSKKQSHITFLHVFHHISMVIVSWLVLKYVAGGVLAFGPVLNLGVHAFMYAYYFVTLYSGPVDIFWKKMMTIIQLVQFFLGLLIFTINFLNPYCGFPKKLLIPVMIHGWIFVYLFSKFYYNSYICIKPSAAAAAHTQANNGVSKSTKSK